MQFARVELGDVTRQVWPTDGPLMVLPYTDEAMAVRAGELACKRAGVSGGLVLAVHDAQRQGFVKTVNQVFAASQGQWFGYMAQDAFAGRDWMAIALRVLQERQGVLLGFNDGKWHGALAGFGMARRAWAQANYDGSFFNTAYNRHFADVELTLLAMQAKRYVYAPQSVLVEVDWGKDAASVHGADRQVFHARLAQGLDGRVTDVALLKMFS